MDYFQRVQLSDFTVVSPDAGGVERARVFAKKLGAPLAESSTNGVWMWMSAKSCT